MQNPEATIQTLNALKALGVRVSIDDFGMGYSSLSQLQRLPIDTLKIDRSFVRDISTDPGRRRHRHRHHHPRPLAASSNVVAEGVETQEQLAFLSEPQCDRVQGYLLSRADRGRRAAPTCSTGHQPDALAPGPPAASTVRQSGQIRASCRMFQRWRASVRKAQIRPRPGREPAVTSRAGRVSAPSRGGATPSSSSVRAHRLCSSR